MRALAVSLALTACSAGAARTVSLDEGSACADPACAVVDRHLDRLIAERESVRKTVWKLARMGDRAIPALRWQLGGGDVARVQMAAFLLIKLGRGAEIERWCRTLTDRDLACVRD